MRTGILVFAMAVAVLLTPPAYAESVNPASGGISGVFTIVDMQQAGHNAIIDFTSSFVLTGTMSGTCVGVERDVVHSNENRTFFGTCNFQGTVGDRSGTGTIHYQGVGSLPIFGGTTTLHGDTGSLSGVSLEASWEAHATGPLSAVGSYSGRVHF